MSDIEKCLCCGATSPVVRDGICGGCPSEPRRMHYDPLGRPEEFINDWDAMIGKIADFAEKYQLPKPEIIIHPEIHMVMNAVAWTRILGTLIHRDVKVRTGRFEQMDVLRQI